MWFLKVSNRNPRSETPAYNITEFQTPRYILESSVCLIMEEKISVSLTLRIKDFW